jgi:hypothetical protein
MCSRLVLDLSGQVPRAPGQHQVNLWHGITDNENANVPSIRWAGELCAGDAECDPGV